MGEKAARQGPRAAAACAGGMYRLTFHDWHPVKSCHWRELSLTESLWDCGRCKCSPCPVSFLCLPAFSPSSIEGPCQDVWLSCCCFQGLQFFWDILGASQLPLPASCALCICVCITALRSPRNSHIPLTLLTPP